MKKEEYNSIKGILDSNHMLSMASVSKGKSYINSAFYAYDKDFNLYFLSMTDTQHSLNVKENGSVAIAIADGQQTLANKLQGLQIFGECKLAKGNYLLAAFVEYAKKHPVFKAEIKKITDLPKLWKSRFYVIKPKRIKIMDEKTFGVENWITVRV